VQNVNNAFAATAIGTNGARSNGPSSMAAPTASPPARAWRSIRKGASVLDALGLPRGTLS
jgi:hypothetical protein